MVQYALVCIPDLPLTFYHLCRFLNPIYCPRLASHFLPPCLPPSYCSGSGATGIFDMSQNMTYDDRNPVLQYSSGWSFSTYNATSVGQTGTLALSNSIGINVSFLFPGMKSLRLSLRKPPLILVVPATDFYYFGFKRSRGARYLICIDCDPDKPEPNTISALDPTDNGQNPPVRLQPRLPLQTFIFETNCGCRWYCSTNTLK